MPVVATAAAVTASVSQQLRAIPMGRGNALQVYVVVFQVTGGTLSLKIEASLDGTNWTTLATITNLAAGYTAPAALTGIGFPFVRGTAQSGGVSAGVMAVGMYPFGA